MEQVDLKRDAQVIVQSINFREETCFSWNGGTRRESESKTPNTTTMEDSFYHREGNESAHIMSKVGLTT